jgi:hypothetical protein
VVVVEFAAAVVVVLRGVVVVVVVVVLVNARGTADPVFQSSTFTYSRLSMSTSGSRVTSIVKPSSETLTEATVPTGMLGGNVLPSSADVSANSPLRGRRGDESGPVKSTVNVESPA